MWSMYVASIRQTINTRGSVHDTEAVLSVYYNTTWDSGEGLQARQTSDLNNNQLRTERVLVWHELALVNGLMYVTSMICRLLTIKTTFLQFTHLGGKLTFLYSVLIAVLQHQIPLLLTICIYTAPPCMYLPLVYLTSFIWPNVLHIHSHLAAVNNAEPR